MTRQQKKVYDYILKNPGCTTHDITVNTFVQVPSARISELRALGVKIESVGFKKYPGSKAFVRYAVKKKKRWVQIIGNVAHEYIED